MLVDPLLLDASRTLTWGAQPERLATTIAVAATEPDRKPKLREIRRTMGRTNADDQLALVRRRSVPTHPRGSQGPVALSETTRPLYWMSRSRYPILGDDPVISQTAEYALRAVVCLGGSTGEPMTSAAIAKLTRVPHGYLSKVLQGLSRAGLVDSQRGVGGGFVLVRSLDELTVLDVINAVDPLKRITPLSALTGRASQTALLIAQTPRRRDCPDRGAL